MEEEVKGYEGPTDGVQTRNRAIMNARHGKVVTAR